MTVPAEELRLAADFDQPTREQWRRLALAVLRKSGVATQDTPADEVERLLSTTYDGISIAPLYTADDPATSRRGLPGLAPYVRGRRAAGGVVSGWDVRARHAAGDAKATREAVIADLENGATSIWLVLGPGGIAIDALPEVLDGVYLDLAGVVLDAGDRFAAAADAWFALLAARGVDPAAGGSLGADPLIWRARTGDAASLAGNLDAAARLAGRCLAETPGLRTFTVDATAYHDAGGDDVDELGCALAVGVAYLRALTDAGLSVDEAFGQLEFRFAVTADQFATIAKLRAARRLWARVAELCGAPRRRRPAPARGHLGGDDDPPRPVGEHAARRRSPASPPASAGADAITVLPFDAAIGLPDDFARRIARNTQALLHDESQRRPGHRPGRRLLVRRVAHRRARPRGLGLVHRDRAGRRARLPPSTAVWSPTGWPTRGSAGADGIAHRRDPITGVSEFPLLDERAAAAGRRRQPSPAGGLPRHRCAEGFEALRDRADAHAATRRPADGLPGHARSARGTSARVGFAANLLAGGLASPRSRPAAPIRARSPRPSPAAARPSPACARPDKVYAEPTRLRSRRRCATAGARRVWLAGRARVRRGVGRLTVYAGCDALAVLTAARWTTWRWPRDPRLLPQWTSATRRR